MEWNDETQAHTGNVEVIPFTYEQIVEIKDLTYTSLIKVQEKLLDLFPRLPKHDYKTLVDNYLNFADGGGNDFAQQYLPEIYEAEVERYGNRTIGGFLRMVGAEMPMMSDQVLWS